MIYQLRHFSNTEILAKIDRSNLHSLLLQHASYFKNKVTDYNFLTDDITDDYDFASLAREFENPIFDIDNSLFDSLKTIETMARPKYAKLVLDFLNESTFECKFSDENLALNNALFLYLKAPDALRKIEQDLALEKPKNYIVLKGKKTITDFIFNENCVEIIQAKLDEIYENKKFGRGIKVYHVYENYEHCFLIRKGSPFTYQPTVGKDLSTVGIYFRAEHFDVVLYSPLKHELKMSISNARTWMKSVYPIVFSEVLFQKLDIFEEKRCISFNDFQKRGEESILCCPEDGIYRVVVTEIISEKYSKKTNMLGQEEVAVVHELVNRNPDFFQHCNKFDLSLHSLGTITGLKLVFYFSEKDKRVAILKNGNGYGFKMDAKGALIECWLHKRGFIIHE